jgi:hypothetical protein
MATDNAEHLIEIRVDRLALLFMRSIRFRSGKRISIHHYFEGRDYFEGRAVAGGSKGADGRSRRRATQFRL